MRFLLDENFSKAAAKRLAAAGHDIRRVEDVLRGIPDEEVLALACKEDRLLITFDKRFSDLIFHERRTPPVGVILLRVHPRPVEEQATIVIDVLRSVSVAGQFTVVTREETRVRPLPPLP